MFFLRVFALKDSGNLSLLDKQGELACFLKNVAAQNRKWSVHAGGDHVLGKPCAPNVGHVVQDAFHHLIWPHIGQPKWEDRESSGLKK